MKGLVPAGEMCMIGRSYTHETMMRTNIEIDDRLMDQAMAASGLGTKRATVEEALRRFVLRHERIAALDELAGLGWEGDLAAMRDEEPPGLLP